MVSLSHAHTSLPLLPPPPPSHAGPTDVYGPRFGIGICIGLTAPAVYCIGMCSNAAGFIISRLFIGFSLATFVACQFWCTSMFNTKVVGTANALAAGWVSAALREGSCTANMLGPSGGFLLLLLLL